MCRGAMVSEIREFNQKKEKKKKKKMMNNLEIGCFIVLLPSIVENESFFNETQLLTICLQQWCYKFN